MKYSCRSFRREKQLKSVELDVISGLRVDIGELSQGFSFHWKKLIGKFSFQAFLTSSFPKLFPLLFRFASGTASVPLPLHYRSSSATFPFLLVFCSNPLPILFRYFSDTFLILFWYFSDTFLILFWYFSDPLPIHSGKRYVVRVGKNP